MLKLISALDASYQGLIDYNKEFTSNDELYSYAISLAKESYEKYIDWIMNHEINQVNHMYFLIDTENPEYLIGFGTLEYSPYFNYHEEFLNDGAISYGVRPSQRNKGNGKLILALLIEEARKLGISELCVSCLKYNKSSKAIIEANGGILEKQFLDWDTEQVGLKYWINVPQLENKKTLS